ncbi:hypothetical protein ACKWTF_014743 [Chironomus riparius]
MIKHHPSKIINLNDIKDSKLKYAFVVLNRPIEADAKLIEELWNHSAINITVDGGTNRWLSWLRKHKLQDKLKHPTLITGDLDSIKDESLDYFSRTKIIQTPDQDATDFTKCLRVLEPFINELSISYIVALCETSGRIDQILANINTLHKNLQKPNDISRPVYILSSTSVTWMLQSGQHEINIPEEIRNMWCSLIPIGQPTTVTTTGLKWNLTDHLMKFGGIVSTSNTYDDRSEAVEISNDLPLLWSMGLKHED